MIRRSLAVMCGASALTVMASTYLQAAVQLSSSPTAGLGVQLFRISPDSMRVVYTGEMNTAGITELFSAPTDQAGMQIQLNSAPVLNGELSAGIELIPNGATVVYSGDLEVDQQFELFSASTTSANTQVKLNNSPTHMEVVTNQFKLTPDGTRVIYRSDLDTDNAFELYIATIGMAGSQIRLTNPPVEDGDVAVNDYFPTSDGTRIVFLGDMDTDNADELYSAPTDAPGMQIKLNNVSAIDGDIDDDFVLTSDGARVVYRGTLDTPLRNDLYSALTNQSGTQIKLNGPTVAGNSGVNSLFRLTPNGGRVMYAGVLDSAGVTELYSAPTDQAGMQIKLNDTPVENGDVGAHFMTPDGSRALFLGDLIADTRQDLFSAPIDTEGQQIQLNTNTARGNVGQPVVISADSSRVIFPGQMNVLGQSELYSAPTDAENLQITLTTNPLGEDGGLGTFTVSPDGSRVAYTGVFTTVGIFDLYVASSAAAGTQVALTNLEAGENVLNTTFTPNGQFVIYGLDTDGDFAQDALFAADALGQIPPVQISDPLIASGQITQFLVTPDSQKVIYRANQNDLSVYNLFNLFAANLPDTSGGLPGDYNDDGVVDAADYVLWRNGGPLQNDPTPGVQPEDYEFWTENFGATAPGAGAVAHRTTGPAAPEPAAILATLSGLPLLSRWRNLRINCAQRGR